MNMTPDLFKNKILDCQLDTSIFLSTLFKWQQGTEDLLNRVIHKYDKNGNAKVIPSLDLGLPNNIGRISGGFLTGSYIEWDCKIPIVPIDSTVNVCSSSVYLLDDDLSDISEVRFANMINEVQKKFIKYNWNFASGNHFIILAKEFNKCYLVLHSSASEFKKQLDVGLYPTKDNWYWNDIEKFSYNGRYIRYIKETKAEAFTEIALKIPDFNTQRHREFAEQLVKGVCKISNGYSKHHYGMPTDQSVNIGCFLTTPDEEVPIFSAPGKDIFVYKTDINDPQIGNKKLIPHGWGKTNDNIDDLEVVEDMNFLLISSNKYPVNSEERLKGRIRNLSDNKNDVNYYFRLAAPYLKGVVTHSFTQLLSYSAIGINDWRKNEQ